MTFREWLRFVAALATENSLDLDLVHEELTLCGRPGFAANVTVSDHYDPESDHESVYSGYYESRAAEKWCYNGWR